MIEQIIKDMKADNNFFVNGIKHAKMANGQQLYEITITDNTYKQIPNQLELFPVEPRILYRFSMEKN